MFAVVQFQPDLGPGDPDRILKEAGITVLQHPDLLPFDRLVETRSDGIAALAAMPQARAVFPASAELLQGRPVRGCPGSMAGSDEEADFLFFSVGGWYTVLNGKPLNWNFGRASRQMTAALIRPTFERVLNEWSRYVQLTFTYDPQATSKAITVEFFTGAHGDSYPFDGRSGSLAHGFYPAPWNTEPIAGDIHLDDDEPWAAGTNPDLYSVLLHEAGHALGLQHSSTPGNVMYPYYRELQTLQKEDIEDLMRFFPARPTPLPPIATDLGLEIMVPAPVQSATVNVSGTVNGAVGNAAVSWTVGSATGKLTASSIWTAQGLPLELGANSASFTASDGTGRRVSKTVVLTRTAPGTPKDNIVPTVTILSPSTTIYATSANKLRISGTAKDNVSVQEVTWQCGSATGTAVGTTTWTFDLPLNIGDNPVIVRAKDPTGNTGWRNVTVTRR